MVDLTEKYVGKEWHNARGEAMNPNLAFLLNEIDNYDIFVLCGGTRCFAPAQKVITQSGSKPISELQVGDIVQCYNEHSNQNEWKPVLDVMKFNNRKQTVKIKLKNGETITCNADHKFFYEGEWLPVIEILKMKRR